MISLDLLAAIVPFIKNILVFISNLHPIFLVVIFGLFVFIAVKAFKTIITCIYIAIASFLFPFIMHYGLGLNISTDISTVIFFATVGVGFYLSYHVLKLIYKAVSGISSVTGSSGPKKMAPTIAEDENEE